MPIHRGGSIVCEKLWQSGKVMVEESAGLNEPEDYVFCAGLGQPRPAWHGSLHGTPLAVALYHLPPDPGSVTAKLLAWCAKHNFTHPALRSAKPKETIMPPPSVPPPSPALEAALANSSDDSTAPTPAPAMAPISAYTLRILDMLESLDATPCEALHVWAHGTRVPCGATTLTHALSVAVGWNDTSGDSGWDAVAKEALVKLEADGLRAPNDPVRLFNMVAVVWERDRARALHLLNRWNLLSQVRAGALKLRAQERSGPTPTPPPPPAPPPGRLARAAFFSAHAVIVLLLPAFLFLVAWAASCMQVQEEAEASRAAVRFLREPMMEMEPLEPETEEAR